MTDRLGLAMDTATDRLSVAAGWRGGPAAVELAVEGVRRHAADLLPLIDEVLARLRAPRAAVGRVVVSDGPGSFTGLRVGAAVAQALVAAHQAVLLTAPSLLVRAAAGAEPGERVLAVSNALRGEVYAGLWWFRPGGAIEEIVAPRAVGLPELVAFPQADRAVGEGPPALCDGFHRARGLAIQSPAWPSAAVLLEQLDRPGGLRRIAAPAGWEPAYGRPAEAQARWERSHGRPLPDSAGDPR